MKLITSIIFFCLVLTSMFGQSLSYSTLLSKDGKLEIVRKPSQVDYSRLIGRGRQTEFPTYIKGNSNAPDIDMRSCDLSSLNLKNRLEDLLYTEFDSRTKWPDNLPSGFNPDSIMELGKDPGLGIRAIHQNGITGKHVGIAIIDQALLVDHNEYVKQLRLYEEIHWLSQSGAQMHGPAVASIAVGKTVGVAPDADLYFIACWMGENVNNKFEYNLEYIAESIDRIIQINNQLSNDKKIRVISISLGMNPSMKGYDLATQAIEKARLSNIETVYVGSQNILGCGRKPYANPNDVGSYESGLFWSGQSFTRNRLFIPMDSRSTASPTGINDYAFYRAGGMSWTIPYLAGLCALACQIKPDIRFDTFWNSLNESAASYYNKDGIEIKIIQPEKMVDRVKSL
jgi:hypothetical protein